MEPEELKRKRKEFLEDTLKYYAEDVSRRAIEDNPDSKFSYDKTSCKYRTKDGKKCAIGRHMLDDKYDPSLEGRGINYEKVAEMIPKEIMDLGVDFLVKMQLLHDCNDNWNDHGLSGHGEHVVADIENYINIEAAMESSQAGI